MNRRSGWSRSLSPMKLTVIVVCSSHRLRVTLTPHCSPGVLDGVVVKTARPPKKQSDFSIEMNGGGDGGGIGGPGGGGGGNGLVGTQLMYGLRGHRLFKKAEGGVPWRAAHMVWKGGVASKPKEERRSIGVW